MNLKFIISSLVTYTEIVWFWLWNNLTYFAWIENLVFLDPERKGGGLRKGAKRDYMRGI